MKKLILLLCFVFSLSGCAAIQTEIEFADLDIVSNTQVPVFLRNEKSQNLFLVVENPIQEWKSLSLNLAQSYEAKGYKIVTEREKADLILAVRVQNNKDIHKNSARAVQGTRGLEAGVGSVAGASLGYLVSNGDPVSTIASGIGGLVVGGLADVTINSWVYKGVLEVNGDVVVLERKPNVKKDKWWLSEDGIMKETNTKVTVRATQSRLTWDKAAIPVGDRITMELKGVLPDYNTFGK